MGSFYAARRLRLFTIALTGASRGLVDALIAAPSEETPMPLSKRPRPNTAMPRPTESSATTSFLPGIGGWGRISSLILMSIRKNKALFLDRDGVINVDRGYVHSREDFHFQEGINELCAAAQALGYVLLVVTNQAGIARGYYTESEFFGLTEWMINKFAERKIYSAGVYYCPYHPVDGIGRYKCDSPDRKPMPGMLLRAQADFNVDLVSSVLIGDKPSDIYAARAAGVGTKILLGSGAGKIEIQGADFYTSHSLDDVRCRFFCSDALRDRASPHLTRTSGGSVRDGTQARRRVGP